MIKTKNYKDCDYSNFIEPLYIKYTPVKGGVYDTKHKNWKIGDGASYAVAMYYHDGLEMVERCFVTKSIKYSRLRQDKSPDRYFWIGFKIARKAIIREHLLKNL